MPIRAATADAYPARRGFLTFRWGRLVNALFAGAVASGFIVIVEPSPYDVLILAALGLWMMGGVTVRPAVVPLAALLFVYVTGGFLALLPHFDETDPTTFMVLSVYLALSAVLLAVFFSEDTLARTELCLRAYAASCVLAALAAMIGYFDLAGLGDIFTLYGRASGTFKDPNVLGSYLPLGAAYLLQNLALGRTRRPLPTLAALGIVVAGIFLSFSRGSWGVFVLTSAMVVGLALLTQGSVRLRRRIVLQIVAGAGLAMVALLVLLSFEGIRDMAVQRFALVQDYDGGETGRFGNQLNAIPMLLERLNGFGPVRFRLFFPEDSHSSYIGAFASYGWLGGFAFLGLVAATTAVGVRQVFAPSPYQRVAQVFWPSLFAIFVQALQIDIDHWRHVYLMLGAVWGIEAARLSWRAREPGATEGGEKARAA